MMFLKSTIILTFISASIIGCQSPVKKDVGPEVIVEDTVFERSPVIAEDSGLYIKNKTILWQVDDTKGFKLQKPKIPGIDTLSVKNMVQLLNSNTDSIYLDFIKTSNDTIYVHISNSEMLTERIGSSGAEMYMASTTYSLTELKGIKYVNYDFSEGDHAAPGVYSRDNFKKYQ